MARTEEIATKLSSEELKLIEKKAKKEGLPTSTYMRMASLKYEG